MSKKKEVQTEEFVTNDTPEVIEETIDPTPVAEVPEAEPEVKIGVVTKCTKLNVRKKPKKDAEIVSVIILATEVMVDPKKSTKDFYKVTLADGTEGFCMKEFIAVA